MKKAIEGVKEIGKKVKEGVSKVVKATKVDKVVEIAGEGVSQVTKAAGSLIFPRDEEEQKETKKRTKKPKLVLRESPELVRPEWLVGSERRFFNFIKKLDEKDKIAIISHNDTDAIVAVKIARKVLGADIIKFVSHSELNEDFVNELKKQKVTKIFMCDITLGTKKLLRKAEKFAKVAIIDHHIFEEDLNSTKTVFLNAQGFCAAYLCYYMFSKVSDLSKMDWLVACASVADWAFVKNAAWLEKIYEKYGEKFNPAENKIKTGKFWNIQYNISLAIVYLRDDLNKALNSLGEDFGNIGDLEKYAKLIDFEIAKAISDFYIKKEDIKDIYFMEFDLPYQIDAVVVNILSSKTPNKTFIVARRDRKFYRLSARRQDGKVNLPEMLKNLVWGFEGSDAGGHIPAAGAHVLIKDAEKLKERIRKL